MAPGASEVGKSGVYPVLAMEGASPDAPIQGEMSWGGRSAGPKAIRTMAIRKFPRLRKDGDHGSRESLQSAVKILNS